MADDELGSLEERIRAALSEERYQQAYELLAKTYYAMVFRHCFHMLGGEKPRAEDTTQRVFAEVGKGLGKFRGEASVKNWLLAIAHKVCLATIDKDRRRRSIVERNRGSIADQVHLPPPQGVHTERHADEQQQLAEALTKLLPEKRSLVVMRFGIGLHHEATIAELMQITGRSRASVHRDLKDALEQLKRMMTHVMCGIEEQRYEEEAAEVIEGLRQLTHDIEPPPQLLSVVLAQGEPLGSSRRGWWATVRAQYAHYGEMLRSIPPLVRWTLVTQSALTLTLVGLLVWQAQWAPERFYHTLLSSSARTPQQRIQIQVVFADAITGQELRTLLASVGGTIIHGPSALGVYTVTIPLAGRAQLGPVLEVLRAHPQVRLAEPTATP